MNGKRWIAVGLSMVVFFSSLVISLAGRLLTSDVQETSFWEEIMDDSMTETVIREGSFDERIALFNVRGVIMNMEESYFSVPQYNHQRILESLETVKNDETIKGIIIRVDSPGGGVYESAELSDKIREVKAERGIPIYVVMESMAASGGYYISAFADKIYATNETITGSLGVIMSGMNYAGLLEKIGVEDMTIKSGEMKDVGSATRELTPKDLEILQGLVDSMYERFVDVVTQGRNLDRAYVYELADGRIYDGAQAKDNGLIDEIGYYDQALEAFESTYGLENAQIITYDHEQLDVFSQWFMQAVKNINMGQEINVGNVELPTTWKENAGFMYMYRGINMGHYHHYPNTIYAGFWIRFFAYGLDLIIIGSLQRMFLFFLSDGGTKTGISLGIYLGYFILMTKFNQGQTLGKMVFGLRVVSFNEDQLSWTSVLIRELFGRYLQKVF